MDDQELTVMMFMKSELYDNAGVLQYLQLSVGGTQWAPPDQCRRQFATAHHYWCFYYGHLECLRYQAQQGRRWRVIAMKRLARWGSLRCLAFLHSIGTKVNKSVMASAAAGYYLDCLQFLHEAGCPWGKRVVLAVLLVHDELITIRGPLRDRQLECLRYLRDQGCPWIPELCTQLRSGCWGLRCPKCPRPILRGLEGKAEA